MGVIWPRVALRQIGQGLGEHIEFTPDRHLVNLSPFAHHRPILGCQTGAAQHMGPSHAIGQARTKHTAHEGNARALGLQGGELWWLLARVGHGHLRPMTHAPAGHGQA